MLIWNLRILSCQKDVVVVGEEEVNHLNLMYGVEQVGEEEVEVDHLNLMYEVEQVGEEEKLQYWYLKLKEGEEGEEEVHHFDQVYRDLGILVEVGEEDF